MTARRGGSIAIALVALAAIYALVVMRPSTRAPAVTTSTAPPPSTRPPRPTRADERPDILLFTIDSVRADHVWSYGGSRHTTPTLTDLAERGVQFEHAYSPSGWTAPAITSLLSGVIPSEHGVLNGLPIDGRRVAGQQAIPGELPLLAPLLHAAGYRTVGVTANAHLAPEYGFDRGFDVYTFLPFNATQDDFADAITTQLAALEDTSRPYFVWVHVVDPRAPFTPREPWFDAWWPATSPRFPAIDVFPVEALLPNRFEHEGIAPALGLEYVTAAYDSEIHASDAFLERVLGDIDHEGLAIVVTSDAGQELMDHGRFGQGHTAFEECVHVPLVMVMPESSAPRGRRIETPVSLVDVMPTLLDLAGVAIPQGLAGRSLSAAARGDTLAPRDVVIETGRGREVVHAIVSERFKYGEQIAPMMVQGLFDLENDPREVSNLVITEPDRASPLRDRLHAAIEAATARRRPSAVVPVEMNERERRWVTRLGYQE